MTTGCVGSGNGVGAAAGVAVGAGTVSEGTRVASGAARVGRDVGVVCGVARGVVLIASGCPQLVSAKTSSRSLQQRTTSRICFRTCVLNYTAYSRNCQSLARYPNFTCNLNDCKRTLVLLLLRTD